MAGIPGIPYNPGVVPIQGHYASIADSNTDTSKPWYQYSIFSHFGMRDSEGSYWQPDANLAVPPGYPIINILSGTVTNVQRTGYGQTVVTVKLDKPVNSLATHEFYEHLHSANVQQGQRVNAGDLIGYTNLQGEGASIGYGFYSGDIYGSGPEWNILQSDLAPGGRGLLNPTNILNQAAQGKINIPNTTTPQYPNAGNCAPWDLGCMLQNALAPLTNIGEAISVFLIAIIMIILGVYLMAGRTVVDTAKKAIP